MKKLIILAASLFAVISCMSQEQKEAKFNADISAFEEELAKKIDLVKSDTTLSAEAIDAACESTYNQFYEKYLKYNRKAYEQNKNNRVGLLAVMNLRGELQAGELVEMVQGLSDEIKNSEEAKPIVKAVESLSKTLEGMPFADFTIEDSDGKTVSFSDFIGKGQYVLVDFWASWCGPCCEEIPNLKRINETYSSRGLKVLGVAVWDRPEDTKRAIAHFGVDWEQIINAQRVATDAYGIMGIPQIILFGPDGTIIKRGLRGEKIAEELEKYL